MDNFFIIIPFLVPLMLMYIVYKQYKNKRNAVEEYEKRLAWFEKNRWLQYIKTIYIDRGVVRFWSAIWYVPLFFGTLGFISGLWITIENFILPPIPLKQMDYKDGVIQSIKLAKKTADSLVFQQDNGNELHFYIRTDKNEKTNLIGKPVRIYYALNRTSILTFGDIVYEVTENNKSIRARPYSYERAIKYNEGMNKFTLYSFFLMVIAAFMIWIQNRDEKPYHRLYRLKRYKKLQKLKKEMQ